MRSFSFLPSRLILVPSALQSHALVPFRPTSSPSALQSHALLPFRPTSSPSAPPVTRPCAFPSHIILVNPSSHMPLCLSVPHHPRQPSSHIPFYLFISFNISSHLCVFSPLVLDPWGKCRVFPRKRFTFLRGRMGYRLHRPLWLHLAFPTPGKVPGFSAKTVHFPPRPTRAPAPQASLAALGISTLGESAGFFRENGSLSPAACRGIGSTGPSGRTRHFSPRGKCRVFRRKRFTFPRGRQGYRLHRPLSRHLPFPPPGKVPGISAKTVHFPPQLAWAPAPQVPLAALGISTPGESAGFSCENGSLSPVACRGTGSTGLSRGICRFYPWGKCRVFPRKRFTFLRGRMGYRLHRPLWLHLAFPTPGKVPGFSAKTVHFPPRPTGALAPQASLAALGISTPGESAGFSCENGSLSPAA